MSNQFRFGGDVRGVIDSLDYIQGMGIRAIYFMGSPFINQPWIPDGYSPLDLTLLDRHHGDIKAWRELVDAIHARNMYILLDNTMATMGDLLGFQGHLNDTTPFDWDEYDYVWKTDRHYFDFEPGNAVNESCVYPRFWGDDGYLITDLAANETGCRDSEFSMYGDLQSQGYYSVFETQLGKFGSVQDRLREWRSDVMDKIKHFSCMQISMLDIDGFRMDKALQSSIDGLADFSAYQRECARRFGKENFFVIGEVVGKEAQAAIYIGRGKQPDQYLNDSSTVFNATNTTQTDEHVREFGLTALDGAAFHYTTYGQLTRLLGLSGAIEDIGVDFVATWNNITTHNDLINANTGEFDPRHSFGTSTQDVFRWPSIEHGMHRQLLGLFITTLQMPGIPALFWGDEQSFYIHDSTAANYVYGRQPMTASHAWQLHGCYGLGASSYVIWPIEAGANGCRDDAVSLDHRDPSHPVRNIVKRMYELREQYPALNDGYSLETLSTQTQNYYLNGSNGTPTAFGIWSIARSALDDVQDLSGSGQGNQKVWLVYTNMNKTTEFSFDCSDESQGLMSPYPAGTVVKNLFYPHDEYLLANSTKMIDDRGSPAFAGCLGNITMSAWGYKALVPKQNFSQPSPSVTGVVPSHDARLAGTLPFGQQQSVPIELHFSQHMDCTSVARSLSVESTTLDEAIAHIDNATISCKDVRPTVSEFVGQPMTTWVFSAVLTDVSHGIHTLTVSNASTGNGRFTNAKDRFMFRLGSNTNPMVFPKSSNYTRDLLHRDDTTGDIYISPSAPGADRIRYSRNWGSNWSSWMSYSGSNITLEAQPWSGTETQQWTGEHVTVQYWSRMAASSDNFQHADLDPKQEVRRWPHAFVLGAWNTWGYDIGLPSAMTLSKDGLWEFEMATEWPTRTTVNVWGMNADGIADKTMQYGDLDGDGVLDWLHPDTLATNVINITSGPSMPYLGWRLVVNDGDYTYSFVPAGSGYLQLALSIILALVPPLAGVLALWAFKRSYYQVKFNRVGTASKTNMFQAPLAALARRHQPATATQEGRRTVLIATMEYEIEDWNIKIKIGGLGVMSSLMSKALGHQNLIWVVPCVGGIEYPADTVAEPMVITINGDQFKIDVQYHFYRNITYVLLDSPVFRQQTKGEPYPARMDDLDSAIYYSAWNACIAEALKRFPVDLYHVNDYHGALAPLHLLPETIPISLSLHNAEFQGMWPLRSNKDMKELATVFNLPKEIVKKYIQFGEVFNLLHAGASYLRIHQKGFGAVGVSKKYGARALKRYPIFWGLSNIGSLPNPDPTDTAELDEVASNSKEIVVDERVETERAKHRVQAQEWAALEINPDAQLFVFVGRWSEQKGVDLIADVFPSLLAKHRDVQLICIGPVIDLYGKFAALKLQKMMEQYPGRVFSKPEFTALPPFIFSGAEFALIPSRDEPFGLVAVEFGRKGALGVGSRVGGLGQMPGWWFTIESTETKHLIRQFKSAIKTALASSQQTRVQMRARSSIQRFPVVQWVKDIDALQANSIQAHHSAAIGGSSVLSLPFLSSGANSGTSTPRRSMYDRRIASNPSTAPGTAPSTVPSSVIGSRAPSPTRNRAQAMSSTSASQSGASTPTLPRSRSMLSIANVLTPRLKALAALSENNAEESDAGPSQEAIEEAPQSPTSSSGETSDERQLQDALASNNQSVLTFDTVARGRKDFGLQHVDPSFNDPTSRYYDQFGKMLDSHKDHLSSDKVCVEEYIRHSEREWYNRFYDAKLSKPKESEKSKEPETIDEFQLGQDPVHPKGVRWLLQVKVGTWPLYAFFLAFGQIIAANSYQITLLTGQNGQSADRLYVVSSIYLGATILWWTLFRNVRSIFALSLPFVLYGLAFFILGMTPYTRTVQATTWVQNVATGLYAAGSASGFLFFAQNFGSEGGTPVRTWVFRACAIQGTQQIYIAALWYWGQYVSSEVNSGRSGSVSTTPIVTAVGVPIAVLMWIIGLLLFLGLPEYYRQKPGRVPAFYVSILRRKVVVWFFIVVVIQNYWLSAPYGRSWTYLWSSSYAPAWAVAALTVFFFVVVWAAILYIFSRLSREHSWALPLFAIGLGAPRWCQLLWGTSGMGAYIPWMPTELGGALLGRSLWLWLGVLDTLQGVGFGMMLLQTLARLHMTAAIAAAQVLGSLFTIAARASAPNQVGPGPVFPNLPLNLWQGISNIWFWIPLAIQLIICVGFFVFFRKEQLFKP